MSLVQKARTLAIDLVVHRTAHDAHCQLDASVVPALQAQGILDALKPEELGGHQLAPHTYAELLEALAQGDSATAWCTMTASTTTLLAAYLARPTAEAVFGQRAPFCAGIFAPTGALVPDGAGFRLTGKWSYASGCRHAEWFAVGALHEARHVVCLVPSSAVRIIENWDVLGLRGTGSHDIAIDAAELPPTHVTSVFTDKPWAAGALYRLPLFGLLAVGIAGCALGIAREALLQANKRLVKTDPPSPVLQHHAQLHARLEAARAYLLSECQQAYARAGLGDLDTRVRGALRLAASHVSQECLAVTRGAFDAIGGAAARSHHPVGNALGDLQVLSTHRMVQPRIWPASMRALLALDGVPPDL